MSTLFGGYSGRGQNKKGREDFGTVSEMVLGRIDSVVIKGGII